MSDEQLVTECQARLEQLAGLLPRVWDVLEASRASRRSLASPDPSRPVLCDEPKHRAAGLTEPCRACELLAEQEGWAPAAGRVPIRTAPVDAAVQAETVLLQLERLVCQHLVVCPFPSRLVTGVGRARRLADLLEHAAGWVLVRAARELGEAAAALSEAIDGQPTARLPADCPHCGRRSLIVFFDEQIIRCNRRAGQVCVCRDPQCRCHDGKRHEWRQQIGTGQFGEWGVLAGLLEEGSG